MQLLVVLLGAVGAALLALPLLVLVVIATHPWLAAGALIGGATIQVAVPPPAAASASVSIPPVELPAGAITDVQRLVLARAAGFIGEDLIIAVAVSIAEDGTGDPAALSRPNDDGTRDLGLWQVNSRWWPRFGGPQALVVPIANARAAFAIRQIQGWCAWSTYEASCGRGHTGSYRAFLARARQAAGGT